MTPNPQNDCVSSSGASRELCTGNLCRSNLDRKKLFFFWVRVGIFVTIFISYNHNDCMFVDKLTNHLAANFIPFWRDTSQLSIRDFNNF